MVYQWKTASHIKGSAQVAGEVCEKLEKQGRLSAKNLLDESRPEDAPLHGSFEWDDSVAAEKYREDQAREIIRSLVIVPEKCEPVRGFFKVERTANTYQAIDTIMKSETDTEKLFKIALNELRAMHRKYASIKKLDSVWAAITNVQEEVRRNLA